MDRYHLNTYIPKNLEGKLRRKAELHGLSISGMAAILLAKGLRDSEDIQ